MSHSYLFTSESVSEGHPDKVADLISDSILDAYLAQDPHSKVACETLVTENLIVIAGEITSTGQVDIESIARETIRDIGYSDDKSGFSDRSPILVRLHAQSHEIRKGVDLSEGEVGAGDQGLMFGYACDETPELMPLPIMLAHKLMGRQSELRKSGTLAWLKPDAKSQVTVRYEDGRPTAVEKVVISTQHSPEIRRKALVEAVIEEIIKSVLPSELRSPGIEYLVNPTGSFVEGGPATDTGVTGRKIIVDTYGGSCPHGGGAFSGKDPTKVDRSGAYAARYVAKNVVATGLAKRCTIQLSYAIGKSTPTSLHVDLPATEMFPRQEILDAIRSVFDLRPAAIINSLDLRRPIYRPTASNGHFGRSGPGFTWEQMNRAEALREAIGVGRSAGHR